jgi:hypothetical protein
MPPADLEVFKPQLVTTALPERLQTHLRAIAQSLSLRPHFCVQTA